MYEHEYIFKRKSTGSILRLVDRNESRQAAVFVEEFNGFQIVESISRQIEETCDGKL
ncbi:MAG: hypothetical protein AMXMBFR16_10780 [Candidatus Uhrbacteria bacterium]